MNLKRIMSIVLIVYIASSCNSAFMDMHCKLKDAKESPNLIFYDYQKEDEYIEKNYNYLDSNRMFIVDTVLIKKPVLISNRREIFITDYSTAFSIDIKDFNELMNNKKVYIFREWETMWLHYRFQKRFPFRKNQVAKFYDIQHEPDSVIYSNGNKVIAFRILNIDSLRLFVCLDNYNLERNDVFKRSHPADEKGWSAFENEPLSRINCYLRVVRPVDYIDFLPLWSFLSINKEEIDIFIKSNKYFRFGKDAIERRNFLKKLDPELLEYSTIPQTYYDSIIQRKYPFVNLEDIE